MPQAQQAAQAAIKPVNYTQEQFAAYLEYQKTGKSTVNRYFDQTVTETNFTDADRQAIKDARFERLAFLKNPANKAKELIRFRQKKYTVVGHRVNVLGNKETVRFVDTEIKAPAKTELKLVKEPKVAKDKAKKAKIEAPAPQAEAPVIAPAIV